MSRPAWLRALLVVAALASVLVTRAHHAAQGELAVAAEAERDDDFDGAIIGYRRAASWSLPFAPAPQEALAALHRIAGVARERQDGPTELLATRAVYAALQSRRWLAASQDEIEPVALRLATLTTQYGTPLNSPGVIGDGRSPKQRSHALYRQLRAAPEPRPLGLLLTVLGFVCWVSATFLLPARGLDIDHRPTPSARRLGTAIVFGFGLFVLGLALA